MCIVCIVYSSYASNGLNRMRLATSSPSSMANQANEFNYPINLNVKSFNRFTAQRITHSIQHRQHTQTHSQTVFFSFLDYYFIVVYCWHNESTHLSVRQYKIIIFKINTMAWRRRRLWVRRHTSSAWKIIKNEIQKKKTKKREDVKSIWLVLYLDIFNVFFIVDFVCARSSNKNGNILNKRPSPSIVSRLRVFFTALVRHQAGWANTEMIGK